MILKVVTNKTLGTLNIKFENCALKIETKSLKIEK